MFFEHCRTVFRTLRFRLMFWNTGVVLAMVFASMLVAHEVARYSLYSEFDNRLLEDVDELRLAIKQNVGPLEQVYQQLDRKALGHAHHRWFVSFLDPDDQSILWSSANCPLLDAPAAPVDNQFVTTDDSFRFVERHIRLAPGRRVLVRVGSSILPLEATMGQLARIKIVTGGLLIILAPVGGFWLAGRAVRPIARIIQTTDRLLPTDLKERLPLRGSGDELDQLSRTINGMLDRIADYLDRKRDFIANAAHELRSPLAAIRTSVEVALNSDRTTEEYVTLLTDTIEECSSLETLVNQLLLLAEGDAGGWSVHGRSARLDVLVAKSVDMFQGVAESRGVDLQLERQAKVHVPGDAAHLRQVINNLIDNAIKFSPPGGRVVVEVAAELPERRAVFRVTDTGAGITASDLPRIFERFYQGDKSRQHESGRRGNGLGLSICQTIVTALSGSIDVVSTPGAGSTFTVGLPLHKTG